MKYEVAIGDVHGEYEMLVKLLAQIKVRCAEAYQLILLGDYCDRGPDTKRVINELQLLQGEGTICLQGNHEEFMYLSILTPNKGNDDARQMWMSNGGIQTRASYGVTIPEALKGGNYTSEEYHHAQWAKSLPVYHETDHRIYVHAGIMPGRPMTQQSHDDMRWLRPRDFDDYDMDTMKPNKHIVFGHTPNKIYQPWLNKSWTGIDTGACFSRGALSAAIFLADQPGGPVSILRVDRP